MVVMNLNSPASMHIGKYYAAKRGVPRENLLLTRTNADDDIDRESFTRDIVEPGEKLLKDSKNPIDFVVFTKGVPIRVADRKNSVDGEFATYEIRQKQTLHFDKFYFIDNPYFDKAEPFSRAKFGFLLACRLDGYTEADAIALVDHSLEAKPNKGPYLLDGTPAKTSEGYGFLNSELGAANKALLDRGMEVTYSPGDEFIAGDQKLAGYCSWGSNDPKFSADVYHKLQFLPGAIAETFVSTSARQFSPATDGQSLIADLIHQGVTGVKGYVDEPYTIAMAHPTLLFNRYISGYNLAESYYMASSIIRWKEIVIGDPLCAPYHH